MNRVGGVTDTGAGAATARTGRGRPAASGKQTARADMDTGRSLRQLSTRCGAQQIATGEVDVAIAGGMENMDRAPY